MIGDSHEPQQSQILNNKLGVLREIYKRFCGLPVGRQAEATLFFDADFYDFYDCPQFLNFFEEKIFINIAGSHKNHKNQRQKIAHLCAKKFSSNFS